jgi:hypothetical protein
MVILTGVGDEDSGRRCLLQRGGGDGLRPVAAEAVFIFNFSSPLPPSLLSFFPSLPLPLTLLANNAYSDLAER